MILNGSTYKEKALHPPSASVGSFRFYPSLEQAQLCLKTKIPVAFATGLFLCRQEVWNIEPKPCQGYNFNSWTWRNSTIIWAE